MRRALLLLGAGVVASVASSAHADILSHWRFDELKGPVALDAAGGVSGTLMGNAHFSPGEGRAGGAIQLSRASGDYVTMGDTFRFSGEDSFSIQVWVKTTDTNASFPIASHVGTFVRGYLISINAGAGYGRPNVPYFYTGDFPGQEAIGTTPVNDGQWHQIVATYAPGLGPTIYVDGGPAEATGSLGGFLASLAPFCVGGLEEPNGSISATFNGLIDDVQIYCGALTPAQVQFLFDNPGEEIPRCRANWNGDCGVNSQDFFDFLIDFFANNADFNHDKTTNSQDFFDFLTAFFSGC